MPTEERGSEKLTWDVLMSRHCAEYSGTNVKAASCRDAVPDLCHRDSTLLADLNQHARFKRNRQSEAQSALRGIEGAAFKMGMSRGLKDCNSKQSHQPRTGLPTDVPQQARTYPP